MKVRALGALAVVLVAATVLVAYAADAEFKPLFNGKDLTGWVPVSQKQGSDPQETWTIKDGIIHCTGKPNGYIRTEKPYENYVLKLEYKFERPSNLVNDSSFRGNSGVLLHITGADKVWPVSFEAQIYNPNAGSLFAVGKEAKCKNGANAPTKFAKPVGEWNSFEITCKDGTIEAIVNGNKTNKITDCTPSKGYICVQSEGMPIQFRNIMIKELN